MSPLPLPLATVGPLGSIGLPILILLYWLPYHARVRTLARERRPVPGWRQACFAAGLIVLAIALSAPVDTLADQLLVAHMVEHLLIGDIAALLIVLGFTGPLLAPLLRIDGDRVAAGVRPPGGGASCAGRSTSTSGISPALYQAALRHDAIHALEHATFLGFGIAMWMGLLGPLPKPQWFGNGARLRVHHRRAAVRDVLANVMIFSGTVLYPYYRRRRRPLAHQPDGRPDQPPPAVMMVEESLLTIGLFCWLFLKVAREAEERQQLLDDAAAEGIRARRAPRGAGGRRRTRRRAARADPVSRWHWHWRWHWR